MAVMTFLVSPYLSLCMSTRRSLKRVIVARSSLSRGSCLSVFSNVCVRLGFVIS